MTLLRSVKIAFALLCLGALQGCAAIAVSLAGMVGGTGLDHTLDGIVARTYASPIAGTRLATLQTLSRMGIKVEKSQQKEKSWTIEAVATDRTIAIELEPLSDRATRATVVASHTDLAFIKDKSTSVGILDQIAIDLSDFTPERHQLATVQMLLADLGYEPGEIDGVMGRNTRKAILSFQRDINIRRDGEVSPNLIAWLRKRQAAKEAEAMAEKQQKLAQQEEPSELNPAP